MLGYIIFIILTIISSIISIIVFKQFDTIDKILIFPFASLIGCVISLIGRIIFEKSGDNCGCEDCSPWSFCLAIFVLSVILTFAFSLVFAMIKIILGVLT